MNTQIDPKLPEELRPLLHDKIDHLDATSLEILHRVLLRLEIEEISKRVGQTFSSRPDLMDRIEETIAEVRAQNPYK